MLFYAQAFHKTYQDFDNIPFNIDEIDKNEAKSVNQAKYCAASAKAVKIPIINEETNEPQLNEDGKKQYKHYIKVGGYHSTKPERAIKLFPSLKAFNFKVKRDTKLLEVLKMYCVQKTSEPRPSKVKGSYLEEFYNEIAFENGFYNSTEDGGNYNKTIYEGINGEDILKIGITISSPDAVYYVPDYLIATVEKKK